MSLAALLVPLVGRPDPWLVWNASASSPMGLYRITAARGLRRGDMALAWPPLAARALGAERHYLPRNVPLVKHVAAAAGDTVCARGDTVRVNGRPVATRQRTDPAGRPMPRSWHGCERLRRGDLLLVSPGEPLAFDGRYFGITRDDAVLGRATRLWPR
ncbi:S26 family signal peptidase [Altererythrobacter sp. Root672]|uniref:S26 family signal peptidase n=1 Tax=Altererythrobacter sp. Root672 TaxID=1736584 RepID=UPI00138F4DDE|nr:S26 family signal peptidase [Altererythrobacter sp. Root672]